MINMLEIIRIIIYGNVNFINISEDNLRSFDINGLLFFEFGIEVFINFINLVESKGIGQFEVKVEILEVEMVYLIDVVERLLIRVENKNNGEIVLDEIEFLVEINGEGKISFLGNGV